MISPRIQMELEGVMLTAFQIYCTKHSCTTSTEGIRTMIRELLPEYQDLVNSKPAVQESQEKNGESC